MWEWLNFGFDDDKKETSSEFKECSKTCSKESRQEEPEKTVQEGSPKPVQDDSSKPVQEEPPKTHTSSSSWLSEKDVNDAECCSAICMYNQFEWLLARKPPTPPPPVHVFVQTLPQTEPLPQITTSDHEGKIEEQKDEKTEKIPTLEMQMEPSKGVVTLAELEHRIKHTSFSSLPPPPPPPPSPRPPPPPPTTTTPSIKKIPYKRKKATTYFPRFIMTVLEALRDLKQLDEEDEGQSFTDIIRYVKENFIVDGDVEAQVKTALRLAHVSGLVVYLTCDRSYRLTTTTIEDMGVSTKRYERFLRRRRLVGNIDPRELHNKPRNCNTAICNTSLCEKPFSEDKETNS